MASIEAWRKFHFAVRSKGVDEPTPLRPVSWIIQPEKPPVEDDPETTDIDETFPGQPEIKIFVKPIQHRALGISAAKAGIPIY